ncbi:Conserved_hypothetical protein [Hexamita inflata]|uniref:Uncharacterized protein n=1 Tax=Hexamita inflata TaxID=28002 RepID=A0AA86R398_9EUKA|nr:Conserved hypothetical protein [Hexamita inflata]
MFSNLPNELQQFVAQNTGKRRRSQVNVDTIKLLQALRNGENITLKQLIQVLTQILQVHDQSVQQYVQQLSKLLTQDNPLQLSHVQTAKSKINLQAPKRVPQSDLLVNYRSLQQIGSAVNYLRGELQTLDNLVLATPSDFLADLQSPMLSEVHPNLEIGDLQLENLEPVDQIRGEEIRTGEQIQFNDEPAEFHLSGFEDFDDAEIQKFLQSETMRKTRGAKKTKQNQIKFVTDEFFEPETVLFKKPAQIKLFKNGDEIAEQIEAEEQQQNENPIENNNNEIVQDYQFEIEAEPLQFQEIATSNNYEKEFQSIKKQPGRTAANFLQALEMYKNGQVDLLQNKDDVFVKGI